jgi:hypothetical protein
MAAPEPIVRTAGLAVPFDPCELAGDPEAWTDRTQVYGTEFCITIGGQRYYGVFIKPEQWREYQDFVRANWPMQEPARGG